MPNCEDTHRVITVTPPSLAPRSFSQCACRVPYVPVDGEYVTCAARNPDTPYYDEREEEKCVGWCPGYAPLYQSSTLACTDECLGEEPYHLAAGPCYARCPLGSFTAPDSFVCEPAPEAVAASHAVSFAGATYRYMHPRAESYAALDWSVGNTDSVEIFLEAEGQLMYLRLRVAAEVGSTKYAPVLFFAAHTVLSSELQLTAKIVANAAILAVVLLRDMKVFNSYVFGSFEDKGEYRAVEVACGHTAVLVQSVVDLSDGVRAEGIV